MDQKQYLASSENTEKKFPSGLELDHDNRMIISTLSDDLNTINEALDHMKKVIVYGATREIEAPKSEFKMRPKVFDQKQAELFHAAMGKVTEAVEFYDAVLKHLFFGDELDEANLFEEIGDGLWYDAIVLRLLNKDFASAMQTNINKLSLRYPDKFTSEAALNRNLDAEREILEGGVKAGELHVTAAGENVGKSALNDPTVIGPDGLTA